MQSHQNTNSKLWLVGTMKTKKKKQNVMTYGLHSCMNMREVSSNFRSKGWVPLEKASALKMGRVLSVRAIKLQESNFILIGVGNKVDKSNAIRFNPKSLLFIIIIFFCFFEICLRKGDYYNNHCPTLKNTHRCLSGCSIRISHVVYSTWLILQNIHDSCIRGLSKSEEKNQT